ncbi:MAG: hypothetical protein JWP64_532 [Pseudonocardia sp.]|jgi:hypothetical protein|uniref:DUF4229 domain-containing protein n=1 Tax=Pseudonocardia sp. TaxID=60912 RepID=UPI00260FEC15|nr:DUF4229 domain-containing protein [Pseudonocardia sp.]MCU1625583.1 hypothetical protein [Pseudonocardia sp.]MDT7700561.1 hypothetical protein [Pseudonocardiales bacterium]
MSTSDDSGTPHAAPGLASTLALYALARIALVGVIAALLSVAGVPLLLSVLLGLIVALPLSLVVFRSLRARLDLALGEARRRRSAERESLRSRLRGEELRGEEPRPADLGAAGTGGDGIRGEEGQPSEQRAEREADAGRG